MQPQARRITIQTDTSPPGGYTGVALDGTTGGINVGDLADSPAESSATTAVLYGTRNMQGSTVYLYRIVVDLMASPLTARASMVWLATWPRLSPVTRARQFRSLARASARRIMNRRMIRVK